MDVSIIIVSFNTKDLLKKCLASIFEHTEDISFEVIVVDNASSDGSSQVAKGFPQVKWLQNDENVGFGRANNQGAKNARGKYLFFFNSDAYFMDNAVSKLVRFADENQQAGAVGPLILNPDDTIQQSVGFFPNLPQVFYWMSFLDDLPGGDFLKPYHVDHDHFYKSEQEVDWITGAAFFVKKDIFQKVGGFDEKIFLYGEDTELCFRIKQAGFKILYSPTASVVHLGRGSHGGVNIGAITGEYKGLTYFYQKYKNKRERQILSLLLKFGAILRILIFGIIYGRKELKEAYTKALDLV